MTQPDHITGSPASLIEHVAGGQGRDDASVLLGLEPTSPLDIEKAGQNPSHPADFNIQPCYAPLLGTILATMHLVEDEDGHLSEVSSTVPAGLQLARWRMLLKCSRHVDSGAA